MRFASKNLLDLLKRSLTPGHAFHAQWFLTRRCNYRCRTCNVWRNQKSFTEITTDEVKAGLDILRRLGIVELVLSGGNPLLRDDIDEIIDYSSRHFITTVYDNGSMAVEKIDALRNADFVAISLDSLDKKENDYIRGVRGAHEKALQAVKILKEEGITVGVAPTISRRNIHEMSDFTQYFISRGVPVWYAIYSYDSPDQDELFGIGHKSDEFEFNESRDVAKFCATLMEMKRKHRGIFMTKRTLVTLQKLFGEGKRTWRCKALQSFFMVDHLGRVSGCHYHPPVTSISNLAEMWNSHEFDKLRKFYSRCTSCNYMCYMFYSLHSNVLSNIEIMLDQAKNVMLI